MPVLLSTLKNKAATAVASQVSSFAKFGTSSGASAISALTGSKGFSSTTSKNLAYPINVEDDPEQGHYIIFYIYEIDDAKLANKSIKSYETLILKVWHLNQVKVLESRCP